MIVMVFMNWELAAHDDHELASSVVRIQGGLPRRDLHVVIQLG